MTSEPRQALSKNAFDMEIAVSQMALVEWGFSPKQISQQVDVCNTSEESFEKYSDQDLILMYKRSWNWSKQLSSTQIQAWLE